MRLDRHTGLRGRFFKENGEQVRWVIWYDDQTHEWEAWGRDPEQARKDGIPDAVIRTWRYRGRCPLRFEPALLHAAPTRAPSAAAPASVPPPRRGGVFIPPGSGDEECEVHGCHKRAVYYTHDTEEVEPVVVDGKTFRQAAAVRRHYFCEACYRLPETKNLRGVESEVQVKAGRPEWKSC